MSKKAENFEKLLAQGQDSALLRYSLGNANLDNDPKLAAEHFEKALGFDDKYSAAWKLLGKARAAAGDETAAVSAYQMGIQVAEEKGDIQASKEMRVFLKRLQSTR